MTQEERDQAKIQLAKEIPNEKKGLWEWPVQWDSLEESVVQDQLRPFVEKKILDYLGMQEDMLVNIVVEHLAQKGGPQELVEELQGVSSLHPLTSFSIYTERLLTEFLAFG